MKILIGSTVFLLLGLVIGWFVEHERSRHEISEYVKQFTQSIKSTDRLQAARDARAIELLDSGKSNQAVQVLSTPIAYYYFSYAEDVDTNLDRKTRAMIDRVASSNRNLASVMTNWARSDVK